MAEKRRKEVTMQARKMPSPPPPPKKEAWRSVAGRIVAKLRVKAARKIAAVAARAGPLTRQIWFGPADQISHPAVVRAVEEIPPEIRARLRYLGIPIRELDEMRANHLLAGTFEFCPGGECINVSPLNAELDESATIGTWHEIPGPFGLLPTGSLTPSHEAAHAVYHTAGKTREQMVKQRAVRAVVPKFILNSLQPAKFRERPHADEIESLWQKYCSDERNKNYYACKSIEEFFAELMAAYWAAQKYGALDRMRSVIPDLYAYARAMDEHLRSLPRRGPPPPPMPSAPRPS